MTDSRKAFPTTADEVRPDTLERAIEYVIEHPDACTHPAYIRLLRMAYTSLGRPMLNLATHDLLDRVRLLMDGHHAETPYLFLLRSTGCGVVRLDRSTLPTQLYVDYMRSQGGVVGIWWCGVWYEPGMSSLREVLDTVFAQADCQFTESRRR